MMFRFSVAAFLVTAALIEVQAGRTPDGAGEVFIGKPFHQFNRAEDQGWQASGPGFQACFARDRFIVGTMDKTGATNHSVLFLNTNSESVIEPLDERLGKLNFFIGRDPSKWIRNLFTYALLRYRNIYPGIDLLLYGRDGTLEYDFAVAPGAIPA